jgi:hypothetical protein
MSRDLHRDSFDRLAQAAVPRGQLVRVWTLEGGYSAQVTAMEVSGPDGASHKLVVRKLGSGYGVASAQTARDEYNESRMRGGLHYVVDQALQQLP